MTRQLNKTRTQERILTLHPSNKKGVRISMDKYETIRNAIVDTLAGETDLTFRDMVARIKKKLDGKFNGSVSWYVTTVKLDMEKRGILKCDRRLSPHRITLINSTDLFNLTSRRPK